MMAHPQTARWLRISLLALGLGAVTAAAGAQESSPPAQAGTPAIADTAEAPPAPDQPPSPDPQPPPHPPVPADSGLDGAAIYSKHCVECHGKSGEGVAGKADEALTGDRTLESLARYIDKNMPEDNADVIGAPESQRVAEYIFSAFYSPTARARLNPPVLAITRLTNRQFRESVADLLGSFESPLPPGPPVGLNAEYFESNGMNKKAKQFAAREDRRLEFDFGEEAPVLGCSPQQFSIAWQGSLLALRTGWHEFRLTTPNGARLYFNGDFRPGDGNRRDDSAAQRVPALIDNWVSSGTEDRVSTVRVFLLGGRAYPFRLDYFKYMDRRGAIKLEWRQPDGAWEVLGAPYLSPAPARHVTVVSTDFPADDASEGYERGTAVNKAWHEATTAAALDVANQVIARLPRLTGAEDDAPDRVDKCRAFLATLAERAFRRPLSDEDRTFFVDRCFSDGLTPDLAVKRSVLLILKSPRFLYPDLGHPHDDYAVAARLALDTWDSLPDAPLLEAAKNGALRTPEQVRAEARRLMDDPRGQAKLREFFRVWLAMDKGRDLRKDAAAYPGFNETVLADLRRSLELFVEQAVSGEASDYLQLLQADSLLLNARLAAFYGQPAPEDPDAFVPVRLDPDERAGVLTHPYLLASHSYFKSTSPIHRGVFLTRQILGRALKPPPQAILFEEEHFDPSLTMREKVTTITNKTSCMTCHVTINPLGFSLEKFDAVGRLQTIDNNKPINTEADYRTPEGDTITLRGPRDVASHAATASSARRGFIRQLFHNLIKQPPAAYGPDTVEQLDAEFTQSGHHIRHLAAEMAALAALRTPDSPKQASR